MSQEQKFSDEFLNAFVDDQLALEEKGRAYITINTNNDVNREVCELRKMHDLVKLAYHELPEPPARNGSDNLTQGYGPRFGIAASILLAVGVALGTQIKWLDPAENRSNNANNPSKDLFIAPATVAAVPAAKPAPQKPAAETNTVVQPKRPSVLARVIKPAAAPNHETIISAADEVTAAGEPPVAHVASAPRPESAVQAQSKVLIHLARDDAQQLKQALDDIEGTLRYYRESGQNAFIEVVVNGRGLELVRVDTSLFAERIQRLQNEYRNLRFSACQNTIDRLKREQGITARLLPGVTTIDSGMAEIMRRQAQGWTYIQV